MSRLICIMLAVLALTILAVPGPAMAQERSCGIADTRWLRTVSRTLRYYSSLTGQPTTKTWELKFMICDDTGLYEPTSSANIDKLEASIEKFVDAVQTHFITRNLTDLKSDLTHCWDRLGTTYRVPTGVSANENPDVLSTKPIVGLQIRFDKSSWILLKISNLGTGRIGLTDNREFPTDGSPYTYPAIRLNQQMFSATAIIDIFAGTIMHELLHHVGYRHASGVDPDALITAAGECVENDNFGR